MCRLLLCLIAFVVGGCVSSSSVPYAVHLVHTNDLHAHLLPFGTDGLPCDKTEKECLGGFARIAGFIDRQKEVHPDLIVLDAGDRFSGTIFYTLQKSRNISMLMNEMGYSAMTLGNHEFDDGLDELGRFISSVSAPIVAANVSFPQSSKLKNQIVPSVVLNRSGKKIGIIGVVTEQTKVSSSGGADVVFFSVADAVRNEVANLRSKGVNAVIVLSHIGIKEDKKLASEIDGIDIIIGGHSHTLLSNDATVENSEGLYPLIETAPNGKTVLIGTAGYGGQYVGMLSAVFNEKGDITAFEGGTRKMDSGVPENQEIKRRITAYSSEIEAITNQEIFVSSAPVPMSKDGYCYQECLLGEFITDTIHSVFPEADIVLINAGSLRHALPKGTVLYEEIAKTMPFNSKAVFVSLTGQEIMNMLEDGIKPERRKMNSFLQPSGLSYEYNKQSAKGRRVFGVLVNGEPIDIERTYTVLTSDFIANGGDGFPVRPVQRKTERNLRDIVIEQLAVQKKVNPVLKKRVQLEQ